MPPQGPTTARLSCAASLVCVLALSARAQSSDFAMRFYGTDVDPADRVRIPIDDDGPGPNQSQPNDLGAGAFTIEVWLRGALADNTTQNSGGDSESATDAWLAGNVIVDRDISSGSLREWGISIAGGFVRFGTGAGDNGPDSANTIEGDTPVLDDAWHHVACTREAITGIKRIYVDGQLDFESSPGASTVNLSYPNPGAGGTSAIDPTVVLGARKFTANPAGRSFKGYLDEVRMWTVARSASEIAASFDHVVDLDAPGMVGYYRFEEGSGTTAADSSIAGSRAGSVFSGIAGEGEWVSRLSDANNVAPVTRTSLPAGFVHETLTTALSEPTVLACPADGRVFIGERGGRIVVWNQSALLAQPLLQIAVDTQNGERGLDGLTLDPDFAQNGWIYAYFTTPEPRNRVARFTVTGNTADPASEFVVWENPALAADFHHGGGLSFGADGHLYIATGDQFLSANSQDLSNEHGKLLRLEPDGSIPADNPFVTTPGARPAIYALGLRNPFRLAFDAVRGTLWVGDVGGNTNTAWEELDRVAAGVNYGWPLQEAAVCNSSNCSGFTASELAYRHDDPQYMTGFVQGCIVAGAFYRASVFPSAFQGNLFIGDYANRWIRRVRFDAQGNVQPAQVFMTAPDAGTLVDLDIGADGALYYLTIGIPQNGAGDSPALHRVRYVGTNNLAPIAAASAAPGAGLAPLSVQFSSAGTSDPDNGPQPLSYYWDFGDGSSSLVPNPMHVYQASGPYHAQLSVDDGDQVTAATAIDITVGNPPIATIVTPLQGQPYSAGDVIQFTGIATDIEDGVLTGASMTWRVVLVHAGHVHPFLGPITGITSGQFAIPTSGHPPENTHFDLELDAVDSDGLHASASVSLAPNTTTLTIDTVPTGIPVFIDGQAFPTPHVMQSVAGFQHLLEAQLFYGLYRFRDWSDRSPRVHLFVAPAGSGVVKAVYRKTLPMHAPP